MIANVHENHATAVANTDRHATTRIGREVLSVVGIIASIAAETRVDAARLNVRNEVAEGTNTAADHARLDVKVMSVPRKTANIALTAIATTIEKIEDVKTKTSAVIGIETTGTGTEIVIRTATTGDLIVITLLNVHTPLGMRRSKCRQIWHHHPRRREWYQAR